MLESTAVWDHPARPNEAAHAPTTSARTSVSANNYRIDMDKLKRWADMASRQELTDMLFRQAVDFQRLGHNHTMLTIENASLTMRVHQLEAQLTAMHEKAIQDLAAIRLFESEGHEALPRFRANSPAVDAHGVAESSKPLLNMTTKLADTLRMAKEFSDGRSTSESEYPLEYFRDSQPSIRVEEAFESESDMAWAAKRRGPGASSMKGHLNHAREDVRPRASSTGHVSRDYELSTTLKERMTHALVSHYTPRHHDAASVIQSYYRRYKMNQRWKAVTLGVRRRSMQDVDTPMRISASSQASAIDSSILSLRIAEEVELHEREAAQSLSPHKAHSAPTSPSTARSLHQLAAAKASPAPPPPQRKSLSVSSSTPLSSTLATSRTDATFLSPASHMQHSAQALAAMLDDSEIDESVSRTRTPSPELIPWAAADDSTMLTAEGMRLRRIGIHHFNRDPKKGIDWLMAHGLLRDEAREVADFFHKDPGLNRKMIGEYLGNVINSFNMAVLEAYVDQFELAGLPFDHALRFFLASFRLPGEAQKIERILQTFTKKYHAINPGVFQHEDTPFVLAFSIVMLNTDQHNVANKRKMSKEDFIRNNRGIDNGKDLPRRYLEEIFDRINGEEFKTLPDNTSMIERISQDIIGLKESLVAPYRQFIRMCIAHEIEDSEKNAKGKHTRALYLFSDKLVVTKPRGNKFAFRQSLSLLDLSVSVDRSGDKTEMKEYVLSLVNKHNVCVFRCHIDPTTRGAGHFEEELREMMATCAEIEGERFRNNTGKDVDAISRRSITSCSESSMEDPRGIDSPGRKNSAMPNAVTRIWQSRKKGSDA